ncbi:MAG: FAD binding domain-containing protein [Thermoplasmata archaeon]
MPPFSFLQPSTTEEALAALRHGDPDRTVVLAGGTNVLPDLEDQRISPLQIVSLRHLPWKTLAWSGDSLRIGSTLPLRTLETDPDLRRRIPGLWQAVRAVGSVALRHRATIGGNLGRSAPASDLVPMLLVLDTEVDIVGIAGERTLSVDRFVRSSRTTALQRGELIRSVAIPEARPSAFLWQRVRPANDISQVGVAVAYSPSGKSWRIAVGGVLPRPVLLPEAERLLSGPSPSPTELRAAAQEAAIRAPFTTDRRATEEYRRQLVATLLARAVRAAGARPTSPGGR